MASIPSIRVPSDEQELTSCSSWMRRIARQEPATERGSSFGSGEFISRGTCPYRDPSIGAALMRSAQGRTARGEPAAGWHGAASAQQVGGLGRVTECR